MISFLADIKKATGVILSELDMGGGLGIKYLPEDNPAQVKDLVQTVVRSVQMACATNNFPSTPPVSF